jgi:subtilase family serine protease
LIKRIALVVTMVAIAASSMVAQVQATPAASGSGVHSARVCPVSRSTQRVGCLAWVRTDATGRALVSSAVSPAVIPAGLGPAQFHTAYQLPTTSATRPTIAIIDAFNDPKVYADLKKYDKTFGLPVFPKCDNKKHKKSCFAVLNQNGLKSPLPAGDPGWGLEISLDVQVAHAICQNCKIMLVEASSTSFSDIETAVNTAVTLGATVVSNSYGAFGYDCAEPGYNHPHVAMVVSAGDSGFGIACPAVLNTVVSVGGTRLTLGAGDAYVSESVWGNGGSSGTGSGCSTVSLAQAWQSAVTGWAGIGCGTHRGMNDVAAVGDPFSGAAVYDSYGYGGWLVVGGTSLSAPLIAGVYALAGNAATWNYPAQGLYAAPSTSFHDVTTGSNGSCGAFPLQCNGGNGYDLPTGVGTPKGLGGF